MKCNKYATYLFGIFSVLVPVCLIIDTDWSEVFGRPAGSTSLMVAGIGMIAAGGVSWIPSSPDFTRYLPRTASSRAIVGNSIGGAGIVVLPMRPDGCRHGGLRAGPGERPDPVSFLGEILPMWIAVPYLLIALVGMLLINAMSM
ncbi:cytosine permease [Streptomyces sp. KL116D]|uniref:cytosine permease n=1 Tax=Streptomyces sp. KL116D TaxID=3045152 RepID=UPI003555C1A9